MPAAAQHFNNSVADWLMLYGQCRSEGCSWLEVGLTLLPFVPAGRFLDDLVPVGDMHHIISTKIANVLAKHPTLSGVFDRDLFKVQALDKISHNGYEAWHRGYVDKIDRWLRDAQNISASPEDFVKFLIDIYSTPAMQEKFPDAVQLLRMILEELL